MHIVQCTVFNIQCTVHRVQCTMFTAPSAAINDSVHTKYSSPRTIHSSQYTVSNVPPDFQKAGILNGNRKLNFCFKPKTNSPILPPKKGLSTQLYNFSNTFFDQKSLDLTIKFAKGGGRGAQ